VKFAKGQWTLLKSPYEKLPRISDASVPRLESQSFDLCHVTVVFGEQPICGYGYPYLSTLGGNGLRLPQEIQKPSQGCSTRSKVANGRDPAVAYREMSFQERSRVLTSNLRDRDALCLEPPAEVFDGLNIHLDGTGHVSPFAQS
jgi:hypothetical protein